MIIPINTQKKYNIYLSRGALNKAGEYFSLNRKVLVVTDSGVPKEYSEKIAREARTPFIVTLPKGESTKCAEKYLELLRFLTENKFTRGDCVVAVGGGVIGDLAGFAAATYMRGIDFYNVPTTILSEVDSSIGGKVAIDFSGYKNIVGAFYQPNAVIIDPETLITLDDRQKSNGLAEALKMAMTSDKELFEIFENGKTDENIDVIIEKSLKIKRDVVEADERETGLRKVLNFGHTIAHAIESEGKLYHGECVALGMIPMCQENVRERLINVLKKLNLPTVSATKSDVVLNAILHDKKMSESTVTAITVENIGQYKMQEVSPIEIVKKYSEVFGI